MPKKNVTAGQMLISSLAIASAAAAVHAAPVWNSAGTSWGDSANWGGAAPTSADIAIFNSTTYANAPVLDISTTPEVLGLQFGGTGAAAIALTTTSSATPGQLTSGATATNSSTITLADASGVLVGQHVTGTRIQTNTFVTAVTGNVITLSLPTTGGTLNTNTQLTFNSALKVGSSGVTVASGVIGVQTISAPVVLTTNQDWTNNATLTNALTIGNVYLGSNTLTLRGATGSNTSLPSSGALNGSGALVIDTLGSVTFGAGSGGRPVNTFTGGVTLNAGTIQLSGGNSGGSEVGRLLGTGVLTINGGQINGQGNIAGHPLTISGQVWNTNWSYLNNRNLDMGTGAITLGTTPGTTRTLTSGPGTNTLTLGGGISNGTTANSFTKAGSGRVLLNGANTYSGTTTISAGTLALGTTGSLASPLITVGTGATFDVSLVTGGYAVSSGQTLGGTGTVVGATTILSGGILAPGASPGILNTGDLNVAGTLSIEAGKAIAVAQPVVGTDYDQVNVAGTVNLTGGNLQLTLGSGLEIGDLLFIVKNNDVDPVTGVFASLNGVTTDLSGANTFTVGAAIFNITYTANAEGNTLTGGNDVALSVVPEPATLGLLGLASSALLRRRRR